MRKSEPLAMLVADRLRRRLEGDPVEGPVRGRLPREAFPAGTLYSRTQTSEDEHLDVLDEDEGKAKIMPCRIGLMFPVKERNGTFKTSVSLDVWRRVDEADADEGQEWRVAGDDVPPGFADAPRVVTAIGTIDLADPRPGAQALTDDLNRQLAALATRSAHGDGADTFIPEWKAEVVAELTPSSDPDAPWMMRLALVNDSKFPSGKEARHVAEHFFRPLVELDLAQLGANVPLRVAKGLEIAAARRNPTRVLGHGLGCATRTDVVARTLVTEVIPRGQHMAMDQATDLRGLAVAELKDNPSAAIQAFVEDVETEGSALWDEVRRDLQSKGVADADLAGFDADHSAFADEVSRMKQTKALLEEGGMARDAWDALFEMMDRVNQVRGETADAVRAPMAKLRPFQLAYLLTVIPDIVARADARVKGDADIELQADLIFFPTGGGKTEAFQLAAIFNAFLDRLTGKEVGITAWLRFALRALTIDQTNRLLEVVYHAEAVRRERSIGTEPFRLGLLVGDQYTPVEVKANESRPTRRLDDIKKNISNDPGFYAHISICPQCHQRSIHNRFEEDTWHLSSYCSNPKCAADDLPIILVDDEMRRRPPAFVVGTIDKITGVGLTRRFQPLLRSPKQVCPVHHASAPSRKNPPHCGLTTDTLCGQKMVPHPQVEDWGPSLIILDEVHLLEEELAAFTAQYESTLRMIQKSAGFPGPKAVLASATVAGYDKHVRGLTGSAVRLFPGAPPRPDKGFWYRQRTDEVQRHVLGIRPNGQTQEALMTSILEGILTIRATSLDPSSPWCMDHVLNPSDCGVAQWDPDTRRKAWIPYWTSYIYVLAKHAGETVKNSADEQLRSRLVAAGLPDPVVGELISSDLPPGDLSEMLEKLMDAENPVPFDLVPATDALTEGWDNRLCNIFILNGHPRRVTKDIQGTGRAGREFCGLVIRALHPVKERDRNHYEFFHHYEENRDILIEPSRINRRALRSVDRTMSGVLMSLMYNTEWDRSNQEVAHFPDAARNILSDGPTRELIRDQVQAIYEVDDEAFPIFTEHVLSVFDLYVSALTNPGGKADWTTDKLPQPPMTSLRDVDPGIPFYSELSKQDDWMNKAFRLGNVINRSRSQVLYKHLPGACYDFPGGVIVSSVGIRPDRYDPHLAGVNPRSILPRLRPLLVRDETLRRFASMPNGDKRLIDAIELVRPGSVLFTAFPLTFECRSCGAYWLNFESNIKKNCPNCGVAVAGTTVNQLPFVWAHQTGKIKSVSTPHCNKCGGFTPHKLLRHGGAPFNWEWECMRCGTRANVNRRPRA